MVLKTLIGGLLIFTCLTAESCRECVDRNVKEVKRRCREAGENMQDCVNRARDTVREACVTDANSVNPEPGSGRHPNQIGFADAEENIVFDASALGLFASLDAEAQEKILAEFPELELILQQ